eukprot:CAMPEP_0171476018 /NCGR_PEP_ID=MMETSP0946-20130122/3344_1 /TAXON_ID=109269 /ORGANISM="Vaucheria litorea, Strain CCMP2940" /LENGTH=68 /DNA_ID=CAMNT_0012006207 /DNA_START=158 /DNA_END=361 /DNA_ORIENTATION=-
MLKQQAEDMALMFDSMTEKRRMIELYAGEKMTQSERMSLSAYRVGLQMPEQYEESGDISKIKINGKDG